MDRQTLEWQTLEWQTVEIVRCLTGDERNSQGHLETDGPSDGDSFDPVPFANKLKEVAAGLQKDAEFQAALGIFRNTRQQDINTVFSQTVVDVCGPPIPELAQEMRLLQVAVGLCLYLTNKAPELNIQQATASFLNRRLGRFVNEQGGWGSLL